MSKVAEKKPVASKDREFKTVWVKVADIIPTKDNTRDFEKPERIASLKELADQIKRGGLLHPIVLRPHPSKPGKYDLRAGERRWRAHKLAGLDLIEARVRKMSDLDAEEATFIENYSREQLTPMETAKGVQKLLESKTNITLKEISDRLGMSVSMVLRRARLTVLIEAWQKAMDENAMPDWGTGHYMSISRFDAPMQEHLFEVVKGWRGRYNEMTLNQFEKFLASQTRIINLAQWDPADETLVPEAGACNKCRFRSSCNPGLFDAQVEPGKVQKKDQCLNLPCWEKKTEAMQERAKAQVIKKHPGIAVISSMYNSQKENIPGRESIERAKKSEQGAFLAVWGDGEDIGKTFYAKPVAKASRKVVQSMTGKEPGPTPLKDRRAVYAKRRNVHVLGAMVELVKEGRIKTPGLQEVLTCAAIFGTSSNKSYSDSESWALFDKLSQGAELGRVESLWNHVAPVVAQRLKSTAADSDPDMKEAHRWASLVGIDLIALQEAALSVIPDPKVWATLNEDGTVRRADKTAD